MDFLFVILYYVLALILFVTFVKEPVGAIILFFVVPFIGAMYYYGRKKGDFKIVLTGIITIVCAPIIVFVLLRFILLSVYIPPDPEKIVKDLEKFKKDTGYFPSTLDSIGIKQDNNDGPTLFIYNSDGLKFNLCNHAAPGGVSVQCYDSQIGKWQIATQDKIF